MSLWITTSSGTEPRWWRKRYPFHVTRYPLDAVPPSCHENCPPSDWCYLMHTRLMLQADVQTIWELALEKTHSAGFQCGGHNGDPLPDSIAYTLAHALEHLAVVDLVSRFCVRWPQGVPVGVFWPMATTLGFHPSQLSYALFYIRRGFAINDAQEEVSVRRAVVQVYQHLRLCIGYRDAMATPVNEVTSCACG
jgi:hypothetical protein